MNKTERRKLLHGGLAQQLLPVSWKNIFLRLYSYFTMFDFTKNNYKETIFTIISLPDRIQPYIIISRKDVNSQT